MGALVSERKIAPKWHEDGSVFVLYLSYSDQRLQKTLNLAQQSEEEGKENRANKSRTRLLCVSALPLCYCTFSGWGSPPGCPGSVPSVRRWAPCGRRLSSWAAACRWGPVCRRTAPWPAGGSQRRLGCTPPWSPPGSSPPHLGKRKGLSAMTSLFTTRWILSGNLAKCRWWKVSCLIYFNCSVSVNDLLQAKRCLKKVLGRNTEITNDLLYYAL